MTSGEEPHAQTRRMMETAIRRLDFLEYVILGVAMLLALVAGALTAWTLQSTTGVSFRISWFASSFLFFAVPGFLVLLRERRSQRTPNTKDPDNGSATQRKNG